MGESPYFNSSRGGARPPGATSPSSESQQTRSTAQEQGQPGRFGHVIGPGQDEHLVFGSHAAPNRAGIANTAIAHCAVPAA